MSDVPPRLLKETLRGRLEQPLGETSATSRCLDPDTLAARVFQAECEAYPEAIKLIAEGRVTVKGRRVVVS